MPEKPYRVGICTDGRRHAAVRHWLGRSALCGAGRIVFKLDGPFDPRDRLACVKCSALIRNEG